jgi:sugar transferase (PEP-CTERM/EpsH1 system associated)
LKILFVVPYTPTPIRTRSYNLLRALNLLGHQVTLATVWENENERQWLNKLSDEGISVIASSLRRSRIVLNFIQAFTTGKPLQAYYSWQPDLAKRIANILISDHHRCDIIHVEHLRGAIFGLRIKAAINRIKLGPPIVWDSVDNISSLFEQAAERSESQFGRWITRFELPRTRRFERFLVDQFDRLLVTSPDDQQAFERLCPTQSNRSTIEILTNGVDLDYFSPRQQHYMPDTIILTGKLSYHANVTSALFLVKEVMPIVWTRRPQVRVVLAGKDPTSDIRALAKGNPLVQVTGTLPDLRPYLCQASVAAAPLIYAAGVQNKVLEAMACGTPVVATTKAVSALQAVPGQDVLVADNAQGLAEALLRILKDEDLRQKIGNNGRQYVLQHHDWSQVANQLVSIYANLLQTNDTHTSA